MRDFMKYVGVDVMFDKAKCKVNLSNCLYIMSRYSEFQKIVHIPVSPIVNLRDAVPNESNESILPDTGAFRFIADRARPDILVAAGELATGGATAPSDLHVKTVTRVKQYLMETKDLNLTLGGLGNLEIFAYTDASYIKTGNCKSRLGGCIFLGTDSGAVHSFSQNDSMMANDVSHSSTESEIKAIDICCRVLKHVVDLVCFIMRLAMWDKPIVIFVDNTSAIAILESLKADNRLRHINTFLAYLRELIIEGFIELHFVPTDMNVADILTKFLGRELYERHREKLMKGHGGVMPTFDGQNVHVAVTACMFAVATERHVQFCDEE